MVLTQMSKTIIKKREPIMTPESLKTLGKSFSFISRCMTNSMNKAYTTATAAAGLAEAGAADCDRRVVSGVGVASGRPCALPGVAGSSRALAGRHFYRSSALATPFGPFNSPVHPEKCSRSS